MCTIFNQYNWIDVKVNHLKKMNQPLILQYGHPLTVSSLNYFFFQVKSTISRLCVRELKKLSTFSSVKIFLEFTIDIDHLVLSNQFIVWIALFCFYSAIYEYWVMYTHRIYAWIVKSAKVDIYRLQYKKPIQKLANCSFFKMKWKFCWLIYTKVLEIIELLFAS